MRHFSSLTICAIGFGLLILSGCANHDKTAGVSATDVHKMSDLPGESDIHASYITPQMQRFDAGIGDTATGIGGGRE